MVWSVICAMSTGSLEIIEGNLNGYHEIIDIGLCPNFVSSSQIMTIFMHDGAPCQTTKSVKNNPDLESMCLWNDMKGVYKCKHYAENVCKEICLSIYLSKHAHVYV